MFGAVASLSHLVGVFPQLLHWSEAAGEFALAHVGWGFSLAVPTMLGFYAIVTGGQLLHSPSAAATRRLLGGVAVLIFLALVPALLLIVVACLRDAALAGALFVIVPAYGLMLFLAVQLGGFVFDREARLLAAIATRSWARGRIKALSRRSRRPPAVVVVGNAVIAAGIGSVVNLATVESPLQPVWPTLHAIVAMSLAFLGVGAVGLTRTSRDRSGMVLLWVTVACVYLVLAALIVQLGIGNGEQRGAAAGLLTVAVLLSLSTFWPLSWSTRVVIDWFLRGAATRDAVRSISRRLVNSVSELAVLSPPPEPRPSLLTRVCRILRRWASSSSI